MFSLHAADRCFGITDRAKPLICPDAECMRVFMDDNHDNRNQDSNLDGNRLTACN